MMPKEFIVIIVVIFILIIILIIYVRGKIIDSKIMKHSIKIESLLALNKNYNFHDLKESIKIEKHYDNKSNYNKIEPAYLMSAHVRNNLSAVSDYISKMKENREQKANYKKEWSAIISQPLETEYYKELKISRKEYLRREDRLFYDTILNPIVNCSVRVDMSYSSAKGQVNLSKSGDFSFDDLLVSFDSVSRTYLDKDTYSKITLVERGEISDSLRYDILRRDNFKCVICGASSKEGARLHVDHIVPVSKGGKSVPDNLRTLCERCNVGKSDKLEEDLTAESEVSESDDLLCPECGAKLVLRHGKNGEFYGCSNFPKCKYTRNV